MANSENKEISVIFACSEIGYLKQGTELAIDEIEVVSKLQSSLKNKKHSDFLDEEELKLFDKVLKAIEKYENPDADTEKKVSELSDTGG